MSYTNYATAAQLNRSKAMAAKKPHDHRPAIRRALKHRPMSLGKIVTYLGAQNKWDAIQRTLQGMRKAGEIRFRAKKWELAR